MRTSRSSILTHWRQRHDEDLLYTPDDISPEEETWLRHFRHDRPCYYRLEGRTPVPVVEAHRGTWLAWRLTAACQVAFERMGQHILVSTWFTGVDARLMQRQIREPITGPPLLFKTRVVRSDVDGDYLTDDYSTWAEALTGHGAALCLLRNLYV